MVVIGLNLFTHIDVPPLSRISSEGISVESTKTVDPWAGRGIVLQSEGGVHGRPVEPMIPSGVPVIVSPSSTRSDQWWA